MEDLAQGRTPPHRADLARHLRAEEVRGQQAGPHRHGLCGLSPAELWHRAGNPQSPRPPTPFKARLRPRCAALPSPRGVALPRLLPPNPHRVRIPPRHLLQPLRPASPLSFLSFLTRSINIFLSYVQLLPSTIILLFKVTIASLDKSRFTLTC